MFSLNASLAVVNVPLNLFGLHIIHFLFGISHFVPKGVMPKGS